MVDINLLPEELRRKEKPKPKGRVIEIEVVKPPAPLSPPPTQKSPSLPLWTKVLGTPEEREAKQKARLFAEARARQAAEEKQKAEETLRKAHAEEQERLRQARLAGEAQARQARLAEAEKARQEKIAAETAKRKSEEESRQAKIIEAERARQEKIVVEQKAAEEKKKAAEALKVAELEKQKQAVETQKARQALESQERQARALAEQKRKEELRHALETAKKAKVEAAKITLLPSKVTPLAALPPRALPLLLPLLISLGFLLVIGGGIFSLTQTAKSENTSLTATRDSLQGEVQKTETTLSKAFDLQRQMNAAGLLLSQHHYLTQFLAFLEANTLPDVSYSKLVLAEGKKVTLSVLAPSFTRAGEELLLLIQAGGFLENLKFSKFSREGTEYGEKIKFDIDGSLTPKAVSK